MANHLYAIHDFSREWASLVQEAGVTAWVVQSESIGDDPKDFSGRDYNHFSPLTPLVRLNYSHHGLGTIPLPHRYPSFAVRCANFVSASPGCSHWIIGNEPNWSVERPEGREITPHSYAEAFNLCFSEIRRVSPSSKILVGAVAPYNIQSGPWIAYYAQMLELIKEADGLTLHCYSRGNSPTTISSEAKMDAPFSSYYNGFRAYRDFLSVVPDKFKSLPAYITETNQMEPWRDVNSGWVREAYAEIDAWNQGANHQTIHCLSLYRWESYDDYAIEGKSQVIEDFKDALKMNFLVEKGEERGEESQEHKIFLPLIPTTRKLEWDSRLSDRGVKVVRREPNAPGWRVVKAQWFNVEEARGIGPDHHILVDALDEQGERLENISFLVSWPSGKDRITTKKNPGYPWAADFAMNPSLNEYSIIAVDGEVSDEVTGLGMGIREENPAMHTSTLLVFQRTGARNEEPMFSLVHPVAEPRHRRITQVFGVNGDYYSRFSVDGVPLRGHNGVDFGTPLGTLILAVDEGRVVEVADEGSSGYGKYIKISHSWGESLYAHLLSQAVIVGQTVQKAQVIAASGNSGNSTGPHLHFGLRIAPFNRKDGMGGFSNPLPFLGSSNPPPTPTAPPPTPQTILRAVISAASEFKVDWRLLVSLIHNESSFNPQSVNPKSGASGLGNIMPLTWDEWSEKVGAKDIFNVTDNARVTAAYLSWCINTAGGIRKGLWAYVWGIRNVQEHLDKLPQEVIEYATKVIHGAEVLKIVNP